MEIPGEITFNETEKPEIANFSTGSSMIQIGKDRIDSLKNSINEIRKLIGERSELSQNFIKEGDEIKLEIDNLLLDNENSSKSLLADKDVMIEKNALRNKKVEISELQLNEKINCWKDIALLKKELRQYEKELSEKEARLKEINDLMSEDAEGAS
jgi:hypothetical protein